MKDNLTTNVSNEAENPTLNKGAVIGSASIEPKDCEKEWVENICDNCEFKNYTMVGHPGGSSVHSVKKYYCELDYWEDDF